MSSKSTATHLLFPALPPQHYKSTKSTTLQFSVVHYAGSVIYDVAGWIAKNRDVLTPSVMSVLQETSNDLVRHLFSISQTQTGGLESNEAAARVAERQENARELVQVGFVEVVGTSKTQQLMILPAFY